MGVTRLMGFYQDPWRSHSCAVHVMDDAELISKAQGADVFPKAKVEELKKAAREVKYARIENFFNSRDGILLRRAVRVHPVIRCKKSHCGLCGNHVPGALRPRTDAFCATCHIPLCTIPRKGETGLSCFQAWHEFNTIERRVYETGSGRRKENNTNQPNAQPTQESVPSENEHPESSPNADISESETESNTRAPSPVNEEPPEGPQEHENPEVEPEKEADSEAEEEEAEKIIRGWSYRKSVREMMENLTDVLPNGAEFSPGNTFSEQNMRVKRKIVLRAMSVVHPDKIGRFSPSSLDRRVSRKAFEKVHEISQNLAVKLERDERRAKRTRRN